MAGLGRHHLSKLLQSRAASTVVWQPLCCDATSCSSNLTVSPSKERLDKHGSYDLHSHSFHQETDDLRKACSFSAQFKQPILSESLLTIGSNCKSEHRPTKEVQKQNLYRNRSDTWPSTIGPAVLFHRRACSTEAALDPSGALVEHLELDDMDHPTDAELDRVMGEPTSSSGTTVVNAEAGPKVSIEAMKLFNRVWEKVVAKMGGIESLNIPKEIVWLNGAPGSGKGANTPFILQTRGFPTKAISISSLLQGDSQAQEIMNSGALLSDSHVLELVLEGILRMGFVDSPDEEGDEIPDEDEIIAGVVVDGFPRTTMQVDFVKLLNDKLADLHYTYLNTPQEHHFPRPIFRIAVLYVEEEESVRRQLHRGKAALAHNQRVKESGLGDMVEVRDTDLDEKAARRRYQIFREHYDTLLRLKSFFPFHLIDAMGTLAQCREQIAEELQYQSGLELGEDTFRTICHLPLAKNLVKQARQNMVTRLDGYMKHQYETFIKVIDIIEHDVIPVIRKCALAGVALYNTEQDLFFAHPEAAEMLADVLSERGYYVTWQTRTREIPVKVDLSTGDITCEKRVSLQFRVKFDRPVIRNPILYPGSDEKG